MNCSNDRPRCFSRCIKFALLGLVGLAAITWVVMHLWNCLVPSLFVGVARIGYWQALALLVLCRILFGGLRGACHRHCGGRHGHWDALTPEERESLKGRFKSHWSGCCRKEKDQEKQD